MRNLWIVLAIMALSACGADVATSTATVAKMEAEGAKQAIKTKEYITDQIDAAMVAGQKRLHEADQAIH